MTPPRGQSDQDVTGAIVGFSKQVAEMSGKIGELTGQVRELIHQGNNTSQKLDAVGPHVIKLQEGFTTLKEDVGKLKSAFSTLQEAEQHRTGAYKFANSLRSWAPAVVIIVGVIIMFLKMSGKI